MVNFKDIWGSNMSNIVKNSGAGAPYTHPYGSNVLSFDNRLPGVAAQNKLNATLGRPQIGGEWYTVEDSARTTPLTPEGCVQAGGTWDSVQGVCILANSNAEGAVGDVVNNDGGDDKPLEILEPPGVIDVTPPSVNQMDVRGHEWTGGQNNNFGIDQTTSYDPSNPGRGAIQPIVDTSVDLISENEKIAKGHKIGGQLIKGANDIFGNNPFFGAISNFLGVNPLEEAAAENKALQERFEKGKANKTWEEVMSGVNYGSANTGVPTGSLTDFVSDWEGFSPTAYDDGFGNMTIGYGTTEGVKEGDTITEPEAKQQLTDRLTSDAELVNKAAANFGYNFSPAMTDALTSFTYNTGAGNLNQLLAGGTRTEAEIAEALTKYINANGEPVVGLENRRNAERDLFQSDTSSSDRAKTATERLREQRDDDRGQSHEEIIAAHKAIRERAAANNNTVHQQVQSDGPKRSTTTSSTGGGTSGGNKSEVGGSYDPRGGGWNKGGMVPMNLAGILSQNLNCGGKVGYNEGGVASTVSFGEDPNMGTHPYQREGAQHDTVPANLTPGEMVIDADSTHAIEKIAPGFLEKVNRWEPGMGEDKLKNDIFNTLEDITITKKDESGNSMTFKSGKGARLKDMFGGM